MVCALHLDIITTTATTFLKKNSLVGWFKIAPLTALVGAKLEPKKSAITKTFFHF